MIPLRAGFRTYDIRIITPRSEEYLFDQYTDTHDIAAAIPEIREMWQQRYEDPQTYISDFTSPVSIETARGSLTDISVSNAYVIYAGSELQDQMYKYDWMIVRPCCQLTWERFGLGDPINNLGNAGIQNAFRQMLGGEEPVITDAGDKEIYGHHTHAHAELGNVINWWAVMTIVEVCTPT